MHPQANPEELDDFMRQLGALRERLDSLEGCDPGPDYDAELRAIAAERENIAERIARYGAVADRAA